MRDAGSGMGDTGSVRARDEGIGIRGFRIRDSGPKRKLSFKERRELESLPAHIEALEAERERLQHESASAEFYKASADHIRAVLARIDAIGPELEAALARWVAAGGAVLGDGVDSDRRAIARIRDSDPQSSKSLMAQKTGFLDYLAAAFNARPFGMFVAPELGRAGGLRPARADQPRVLGARRRPRARLPAHARHQRALSARGRVAAAVGRPRRVERPHPTA